MLLRAAPFCSVRSFASAAEPAFAIPDTRPKLEKDTGINVARYVQENFTPYNGDSSFLAAPTENTKALWCELEKLCAVELQKGIMGVDPHVPSTITSFPAGYIDKEKEAVVGLQTDEPLKRAIKPLGGINMVRAALQVRCITHTPVANLLCLFSNMNQTPVVPNYSSDILFASLASQQLHGGCLTVDRSLIMSAVFLSLQAYGCELPKDIEYIYTHVRKTHNTGVFDAYTDEMKRARKSGILTG